MFVIEVLRAFDISEFSCIQQEEEVVLLPGIMLSVESVLDLGHGLKHIQLREVEMNEKLRIDFKPK